ncbi:polysaccharide pyruvyl transferase family protein [Rhizobiales bacterium]|uniref:polysaccharide pyruvyl transferase family protein n=1 Tax=Hongsoonwoonella zoysiae TaxID=2821844 RepID=UPI00155F6FFC|nr:polysaccharide pyruvyl transferase family protein [Hongsoonwoonella zoysiae]NRG16717.1 polysaccharide pyruvyl transferase family protein [Hongsoonwoonella zoysiae]
MVNVQLFGDHSQYHCGSWAVIEVIKNMITENNKIVSDNNYDILIVNGEGSMHHDTPHHKAKMNKIKEAIELDRKVFLVNTVWQDNNSEYDEILKNIDGITTREILSQQNLYLRHGIESTVFPDLSLQLEIDDSAEHADVKGHPTTNDFLAQGFGFVRITEGIFSDFPFLDMKLLPWSTLVKTLRTSSLLITGRHHGVMAACKAKTPFAALAGNTHKIEGFIKTSGINIRVAHNPRELLTVANWAKKNKSAYDEFFEWVDELPKWKLPF